MSDPKLLTLYRDHVRPEWIDYNGHMNEAFYLLVFSRSTDAFMDRIGMDHRSEARKETSLYTLETHLCYMEETGVDEAIEVGTLLVDHDAKRAHLFHRMFESKSGKELATAEILLLHVDMTGPKSSPFSAEVAEALEEVRELQAGVEWPKQIGRSIGIRRR